MGGGGGIESRGGGVVGKLGGDFGELVKESCWGGVRIVLWGRCVGLG